MRRTQLADLINSLDRPTHAYSVYSKVIKWNEGFCKSIELLKKVQLGLVARPKRVWWRDSLRVREASMLPWPRYVNYGGMYVHQKDRIIMQVHKTILDNTLEHGQMQPSIILILNT